MKITPIRLTLLNHLFYYTEISGGSTSATATGAFVGDLALTYALQKSIVGHVDYYSRFFRLKPKYEEIADFGFYVTVGKPLEVRRTENYIRNTLFNVDGFIDVRSIEKSGKSPFKNFRQSQGLQLGLSFDALLLSKHNITLPPTIRIGTGRETLVAVEEVNDNAETEYWLNAFTLKIVFNNLDKTVDLMMREGNVNFSYILENYNLIKKMRKDHVVELFEGIF